jgi:putative ABC transport system permease protein
MSARTRGLALLRALGASRGGFATVALCEAAMIGFGALGLGVLLAAGLLALVRDFLLVRTGLLLQPELDAGQIALLLGGTVSAILLAAAIPSLRAVRTEIEELLRS